MRISYTPEQEDLRRELRAYFSTLMTAERREALMSTAGEYGSGNVYRETVAQMGRDGWLALGWPTEYGGQARSTMDQLIFTDEAAVAGAPVPFLTINSVAPTIMALRHRGAEAVLPARDRARRYPLLHRLLRARRRNRPGQSAHHGRPRRRRLS